MIKGKLGLKWRGTILMTAVFAAPIAYIVLTGGPEAQKSETKLATKTDESGIRMLPPDEPEPPTTEPTATEPPQRPPVRKPPPATTP